jgi:hypothetical protein
MGCDVVEPIAAWLLPAGLDVAGTPRALDAHEPAHGERSNDSKEAIGPTSTRVT